MSLFRGIFAFLIFYYQLLKFRNITQYDLKRLRGASSLVIFKTIEIRYKT